MLELAGVEPDSPAFQTNFSGGLPRVSAGNLVGDEFPSGLFSGRIVFLIPNVGGLANWTQTPFGQVSGETIRAEKVATVVDRAGIFYSHLLEQLLFLFGMAIGGWAFGRRRSLVWLSAVSGAWLILELVAFGFQITLGGPLMLFGVWATFFIGLTVAADRKEQGLEVQVRLVEAVKDAQNRRAHQVANDPSFWPRLAERANSIVTVPSMAIAELPPESWWIAYRSFQNMNEEYITERRRDVRRSPYREAFTRHVMTTSGNYVADEDLDTVFIPLVAREKVVGFWIINHPEADEYMARNRTPLERIARQLAQEIHWNQLDSDGNELIERDEVDVLDSALAAMEHLELDRRVLQEVIENANVGLMTTNLFGEVTFQNDAMDHFFADLETTGQESVFDLFAMLVDKTPDRVQREFNSVLETRNAISYSATTTGEPKRRLEFRIGAVQRRGQGSDVVRTLLITAIDVSSTIERETARLEVVEARSARAQDLVRALSGYTSALDDETSRVDINRGLEASVQELSMLVADVDIALGMDVSDVTQLPLNVQLTIREALRAASLQADLPNVELSLPERTVLARGEPEIVQRAIRLLILDATDLAPGDTKIRIEVEEEGDALVIHVRVPDVAVPNSLLQQMLEGDGDSSNRLFMAKNHVETGGGKLKAESSLSGGLHFSIRLIRDG